MNEHNDHDSHDNRKISITIDGRPYAVHGSQQEAATLLRLADLDPDLFDLAKVNPGEEIHRYDDDDQIELAKGDDFVTIRQSASVA